MSDRGKELETQSADIVRGLLNLPAGGGTPGVLVETLMLAAMERLKDALLEARSKTKGK